MAKQACERFSIPNACSSVEDLLDRCRPDVVHITTPPQSHYPIARACLEKGCHVYVEKPFTVCAPEAETLLSIAQAANLKVTVGHDLQFSHAARRLRRWVRQGWLGGAPVHIESYYCYDLSDPRYARVLLADSQHWVRRLPGGLLHNIISHGIARIAEYMLDDAPTVIAHGFVSPLLQRLGEKTLIDELRVILRAQSGMTAYFTFSSQMRPSLNHFRIFGPSNGLELDEDEQNVIRLRGSSFKSYAQKFLPQLLLAGQQFSNLGENLRTFLRRDFHMKSGMKCLVESFYQSILDQTQPPIEYREILFTARIMDQIFTQMGSDAPPSPPKSAQSV